MSQADRCRAADAAEAAAFVDLYAAASPAFAGAIGLGAGLAGGATLLHAPGMPTPMFNRVIGLGTFEPATEPMLDAMVDRYRATGAKQFWVSVSPAARPARLVSWLEARGFASPPRRSWVQMHWGDRTPPAVDTTLEIRDVRREEAEAMGAAIASAFQMPPPMGPWLARLAGRAGWQGFAALDEGQIVGGAFVHIHGESAWLGMGSILPAYRGRNGQLALMAARIRRARAAGCRHVHTETGEPVADERNPSLDNMVRCGFERIASRANYALNLAQDGCLAPISAA